MKKKSLSVLSLFVALGMLVSMVTLPALAETAPTFKIEGKVVLPGNDVALDGGLPVTLEYRSDRGTPDTTDDYVSNYAIIIPKDAHEATFVWELPFTAAADKSPMFTVGYSVPSSSKYWDKGYYALSGTQYYSTGQMRFLEGSISGIVITPLRASEISGAVGLPSYSTTQTAIEVNIIAKTAGTVPYTYDDYEAKTKVTITGSAISYKIKVPSTTSSAAFTVMYETNAAGYEKQGWYSTTGTAITPSASSKVDVSAGNVTGINLLLVSKALPPVTPPAPSTPSAVKFDLNGDGKVDVKDQVIVAKAMGSQKKYNPAYDLNKDGVINVNDLKIIKAEIAKAQTASAPVNPGNGSKKK